MTNNIVLFDMDGTLSEPRQKFHSELLLDFRKIINYSEIGILTGADYSDIEFQLNKIMRFSEVRFHMHLLPCNGTKHYTPPTTAQDYFKLRYENSMPNQLGKACFRELFKIISEQQSEACYHDIPLTGHFVNYRGSMINWCPIGRNASKEQRTQFIQYDKKEKFRERLVENIQYKLNLLCPGKTIVTQGGQTSIDIYPTGWDKTYALRHFPEKTCWFVGDACHEGGNDHEIYKHLKKEGRAFHTSSPIETGEIIRNHILPAITHS